ncbi:Ras family protein, putative [Ichthyophthirius multifiliis]|uniref:Ras family protein, putative n=1 Tax=Ichthyophthirius multifiliis TaxID=5932 RepID=G0QZL5_ICHMU|nr:Ras family protein, putative [Ichthyophthirius multifiliis]EGR29335.1 Ras family protein, putative [Ichthyophthirius multifiliis]|eukprot:XP_004030571.1 Ras family protein, putative [Ichthyophthirius multifiliis]
MIKDYDYLFKLVIIGNSGVGKSSLLLRFSDDQFNENYLTTIGVDFRFRTLNIEGKSVKLQIWDTAGQERFRTITSAYYKGADGIVLVYDITSQNTFDDIEKFWISEVESYAEKNVELMLIGNKKDLNQQVTTQIAEEYAKHKNMEFFEVSAKTADSVQQAFLTLSKKLMAKREPKNQQGNNQQHSQQRQNVQNLGNPKFQQKADKGGCC